ANAASPHWVPLTDNVTDASGNPIPLFTGCVALLPSNSRVLYVGTGESNNIVFPGNYFSVFDGNDTFYGRGLLHSTDAGATWTVSKGPNNPLHRREISNVVVDPTDPTGNTVYISLVNEGVNGLSGNTGVYKSVDGGATWTNITLGKIQNVTATDDYFG